MLPPIRELVSMARERGATDLHLAPGHRPMARVAGNLEPLSHDELSAGDVEAALDELSAASGAAYLLESGDLKPCALELCLDIPGVGRLRLSVYRALGFLRAAIRLAPGSPPSPKDLGCPKVLESSFAARAGLVIVCGPTGAGKTTTLAALAQQAVASRPVHILTIEDPVEYLISPGPGVVTQRQVGSDVRSFPQAVRESLRQDPDIILVGECRDGETAEAILLAARTGHLVATTLHASSAIDGVERFLAMLGPDPRGRNRASLADVLVCVCYQVLLARQGSGGDGGSRMVAAHEVVPFSAVPAARALLRDGRAHEIQALSQEHRSAGMISLEDSISRLRAAGII